MSDKKPNEDQIVSRLKLLRSLLQETNTVLQDIETLYLDEHNTDIDGREDRNVGRFHCQLCLEYQSLSKIRSFGCGHEFCDQCLSQYVSHKVKDGIVIDIRCPQQGCRLIATDSLIRSLLDNTCRERYESLLLRRNIEELEDVMYCPNCNEPVECDLDYGIGVCESCQFTFCTSCQKSYHGSDNCTDIEEREQQIRQSEMMIINQYKKCPGCKISIEKDIGCNHMTCSKCRTQFCWTCMDRLVGTDADLSRHYASCQLFTFEDSDDN